jgi:hypothetical protein
LYAKFENLGGALEYAYPEIVWDMSKFSMRGKKSEQWWLRAKFEELLPVGTNIVEDYHHPGLTWGIFFIIPFRVFSFIFPFHPYTLDKSDRFVELDLWIPQYQIGIEYQGTDNYQLTFNFANGSGEQHYHNLVHAFGPNGTAGLYSERDLLKRTSCQLQGISLITIPYWYAVLLLLFIVIVFVS